MWTTLKIRAARTGATARTQDEGQTLVEYVLIVGLVSVGLVAALGLLGGELNTMYDTIVGQL